MSEHDPTVYLRHMLDAAQTAIRHSAGRQRADLDTDELYALAMARLVSIVGEAAAQTSPEIRAQLPRPPWHQIVATRHRLIHAYAHVNNDILWAILSGDVPAVARELAAYLPPMDKTDPADRADADGG